MKKVFILAAVGLILTGCTPGNKKIESGQQKPAAAELTAPQQLMPGTKQVQTEEERIAEMAELQKQIQDIDAEISRLISLHREQLDKLKADREVLEKRLDSLYEIEKTLQEHK